MVQKHHHRQLLAYHRQLTESANAIAKLGSRASRLEQVRNPELPPHCMLSCVTEGLRLAGGADIGRGDATTT